MRSLSELVCVRSQCLSKVVLVLLHSPDAMCEAFPVWVLKVSSLSPIEHVEHDNFSEDFYEHFSIEWSGPSPFIHAQHTNIQVNW